MHHIEIRVDNDEQTYWLADRQLSNGDDVMLRLRGNAGWERMSIDGLPQFPQVRTVAADGHALVTTLPPEAELRWPKATDE